MDMNTRRISPRNSEEEMANLGDHNNQVAPQDNQVPPLEEVAISDHVPVVPLLMNDGEINLTFINLAQDMTSQANVFTSQVQAMTALVKREVGP